jgi:hypothetical protein
VFTRADIQVIPDCSSQAYTLPLTSVGSEDILLSSMNRVVMCCPFADLGQREGEQFNEGYRDRWKAGYQHSIDAI